MNTGCPTLAAVILSERSESKEPAFRSFAARVGNYDSVNQKCHPKIGLL